MNSKIKEMREFLMNCKQEVMTRRRIIEIFLVLLVVITRLIPHLANFTPVLAVWSYYGNRRVRPWLLILAVMATDIILGVASILIWVWASYGLIWLISKKLPWWRRGLLSAFLFFAITNYGVYLAGWYSNIWECYVMALPFFVRTLVSTVGYCAIIEVLERVGVMEFDAKRRYVLSRA